MKKVLVCALAALMLMSTCVTALASTPSYVTETTYVMGENEKIKVDTTVTGVDADTMLTYLAYKGAEAADDTIIYIDQQTADADGAKFSYTTAKGNLSGVTVKYGTSAATDGYPITVDGLPYRAVTVTLDYPEGTEDVTSSTIILPTAYVDGVVAVYETGLTIADGYEVEEANASLEVAGNAVKLIDSASIADNANVVLKIKKSYTFEPTVSTSTGGRYNGYSDGLAAEKLTVYGEIVTDITDFSKEWGGIILSETEAGLTYEAAAAAGRKYPALFQNEGRFAVQLVNHGEAELMNDWYACVYVIDDEGEINLGSVIPFLSINE